mgnify:CR=1 FL=1
MSNETCDFKVVRNTYWALMNVKLPEIKVNCSMTLDNLILTFELVVLAIAIPVYILLKMQGAL